MLENWNIKDKVISHLKILFTGRFPSLRLSHILVLRRPDFISMFLEIFLDHILPQNFSSLHIYIFHFCYHKSTVSKNKRKNN